MESSSSTIEPSNNIIMLSKVLNPNAEPFHIHAWRKKMVSPHSQVQILLLPHEVYQWQKAQTLFLPQQYMIFHAPVQPTSKLENFKETVTNGSEVDPVPAVIPFPKNEEETIKHGITTVMIKNIPNNFRRMKLMYMLDIHCRQENLKCRLVAGGASIPSQYDLIYLPMDYRKHYYENKFANLGYAFVNFTTPVAAFRFFKEFNGYRWSAATNSKVCQVTLALHQGKALKDRLACKTFICSSREFMPIAISRPRDGFVRNTYATPIGKFRFGIPQKRHR